jgi:predicted HTH transcriptional regulator
MVSLFFNNHLMNSKPTITATQIAQALDIDDKNAEANIRYLKKNRYVERIGARKNGQWAVSDGNRDNSTTMD